MRVHPITIELPDDLDVAISESAEHTGKTRNQVILDALVCGSPHLAQAQDRQDRLDERKASLLAAKSDAEGR